MNRFSILCATVLCTYLTAAIPAAFAEDWPMFRGGAERHGSTTEEVDGELKRVWTYQAPAPPQVAWASAEGRVMESKLIGHRVKYGDALHPVVAGQRVFFGSPVDHHLHCYDAASGQPLWRFATGAPIRLSPTVSDGRVYVGSDDGYVYCVSAESGQLIWKKRGGPAEEWLLARGDMVSRWPIRTGVLVDGGVAYFGAGIFPHEDVFLHAVDAEDGTTIWQQDNVSALDAGRNDLSPQGYLLASDDQLFVPSGRSMPAAFDRHSGEFQYKRTYSWRTTAGGVVGGYQALLADGQLYASGTQHWLALDQPKGGTGFGWFAGRQLIVQGDAAFAATGSHVARYDREQYAVNSRQRQKLELEIYGLRRQRPKSDEEKAKVAEQIEQAQAGLDEIAMIGIRWQTETEDDAALLATGNLVFVGGQDRVTAYDIDDGRQVWQAEVDGQARGLVFAGGRLYVSTNNGKVDVFQAGADEATAELAEAAPPGSEQPFGEDEWTSVYAEAAEQMLDQSGVRRGFCLVVGNDQGRLAWELARRSELRIYAIDSDPAKVEAARQTLMKTGLYGHRITVHQADPADTFYSNYFANLIVSDTLLTSGQLPQGSEQVARHLKPAGGVMLLGAPPTAPDEVVEAVASGQLVQGWLGRSGIDDQTTAETTPSWTQLTRGLLPGAGDWTHQYGNPANTAVSKDTRVKGGLGVLWFGDPGPDQMVNRHDGAVGPLSVGGKLIVQGEWSIMAYDAYNGLFLWKHENPEAIRTGVFQNQNPANVAASDSHVFHFVGDQCLQLDIETGETVAVHRLPESLDDGRYQWGYLAVQDGILFGAATVRTELESRRQRRGRRTEDATDHLFAIDVASGQHLWTHEGKHISHHTIAIGPEEMFFIDSSITSEQRDAILRQDKSELAKLEGKEREVAEDRLKKADIRKAVALAARSGEVLWSEAVDVTDCSDIGIGGGKLTLIYQDGVLLLGGANANGHYWKQFIDGEFSRRRLVALQADDGYQLWARDANYKNRPIILGNKVLAEPWIYDLHSGAQLTQNHPVTDEEVPWSLMRTGHHCGMFTGCDSGMLLFRSGDTAFFDLETESGTRHFAGHRMGCWINAIPAGGLVMIPEASAGCVCQFSIASTIVMEPREPRRQWAIHSATGSKLSVKQMFVNFGAPGDRRDDQGNLWLAFPRPKPYKETSIEIELDLQTDFAGSTRYWSVRDVDQPLPAAPSPWLYASGSENLNRLSVPLRSEDDAAATYEVTLHLLHADAASADADIASQVQFSGNVLSVAAADVAGEGADQSSSPTPRGTILVATVQVDKDLQIELAGDESAPQLCAIQLRLVP